jgi:uncharacterized membrane protein
MTGRWFGLICVALMYLFGYWAFPYVQTNVPLHSVNEGVVDLWATPFEAVVFPPVLASLLYLIMVVHRRQSTTRHEQYIDHLAWLLMNLAIGLLCVMYFAILGRYFGWLTEVRRAFVLAFGLAMITVGYYLPRTKPEEWIGLRTPWTLASQSVWHKTHLFGRWTFLLGGLLISIAAWLPQEERRTLSMTGFLLATLLPIVYSYLAWRRESHPPAAS